MEGQVLGDRCGEVSWWRFCWYQAAAFPTASLVACVDSRGLEIRSFLSFYQDDVGHSY